jgi:hypothetical protein
LEGLNNFLKHPLTIERSLILWEILKMHIEKLDSYDVTSFFEGTYKWKYYSIRRARFPAKFLKTLQKTAWLYGESGGWRKAREVSLGQLDERYDVDIPYIAKLKEILGFKSDLIDQLPQDLKEKLILTEGLTPEELEAILSSHLHDEDVEKDGEDLDTEPDVLDRGDESTSSKIIAADDQQTEVKILQGHGITDSSEDKGSDRKHLDKTPKKQDFEDSLSKGDGKHRVPTEPKQRPRKKTSRRFSYVYPEGEVSDGEIDPTAFSHLSQIGQKGVAFVLEYEKKKGRDATDMETVERNFKGFDVKSVDKQNPSEVRYIEVKSTSGIWDSENPAQMHKTQFETAQEYGESFWLYVVQEVESDEPKLYCVQNPANQVDIFMFDHGWIPLAEEVEIKRSN